MSFGLFMHLCCKCVSLFVSIWCCNCFCLHDLWKMRSTRQRYRLYLFSISAMGSAFFPPSHFVMTYSRVDLDTGFGISMNNNLRHIKHRLKEKLARSYFVCLTAFPCNHELGVCVFFYPLKFHFNFASSVLLST